MTAPGPNAISVMTVDDHAVVRRGMRAYFEMLEDVEVIGEAADGDAALRELDCLHRNGRLPDVVLMDLQMPGIDGVAAIERIASRYPDVRVIVLTSFGDARRVRAAMSAGARGYLLKDAGPAELVAAVRAAHAGEMPVDPAVISVLSRTWDAQRRAITSITAREREIAALIAEGLSNRGIAERLVISERTVRTHVSNVLAKLGLSSRTQIALWAIDAGLGTAPH